MYESAIPKLLYDCLSEGVAKGSSGTLNEACGMRRQQVYNFPSCWDFGREDTEQRPLSRTQPTAKRNPNLACFFNILDDQTIPFRLKRKLPKSLTPILDLELLRRRMP